MRISEQGLALIKRFEGFSARPYICPAGKNTIGYGHVIGAGEAFPAGGISLEAADLLLKRDVNIAELAVGRLVLTDMSQSQFDALVSLVYNIGVKAFEKSRLLKFFNDSKPQEAAGEFLRWVFAGGRKIDGLLRRRAAERDLFLRDATFTKL